MRRAVLLGLCVLLVALVAAAAWIGVRAFLAKDELEKVRAATAAVQQAAGSGDVEAIAAAADEAAAHARSAASLTGDPIWRAGEVVPLAGPNLTAVRVVAEVSDTLVERVVQPLLGIARSLPDVIDGGAVDVDLLASAAGPASDARAAFESATADLAAVDTSPVIGAVRQGVVQLREATERIAPAVGGLADATAVLPALLGRDSPQTILVVFQNTAELRTGGGITGSFAQVSASAGALALTAFADSSDFPPSQTPVAAVPDATSRLYGDVVGRFVQNASIPSDFTATAGLVSAWWEGRTGVVPDAVLSLDPLVLRAVLTATGPVTLPDGTALSADTLVDDLLVRPYVSLDQDAQTAFFSEVLGAVFAAVTSGAADPIALAQALAEPVAEGRVSLFSSDPELQSVFADSVVGGPDARQSLAGGSGFGVWFNDTTGGKMDVFLGASASVGVRDCRADGRAEVEVVVTLSSSAPADVASYPLSVTGAGAYGVAVGDIGTDVTVAAPEGWFLGDVLVDGERIGALQVDEGGRPQSLAAVELSPGETGELRFRFIAPTDGGVDPTIVHTPLLGALAVDVAPFACN